MSEAGNKVIVDVPCTTCGYNLRMLAADARCPECGSSVDDSLRLTLVRWGPAYVGRVAGGIAFAGILNIVAMAITLLFIGSMFLSFKFANASDPTFLVILLFASYTVIACLHVWAASWHTRPPAGKPWAPWTRIIRLSSIVFVVATLVPLLMTMNLGAHGPSEDKIKILMTAWVVLLPSLVVFVYGSGRHVANLCKLGGAHSLSPWHGWTSRMLALGVAMIEVAFMGVLILMLSEPAGPPETWVMILMALSFYGGLLLAVVSFLTATVLLMVTARRFRALAGTLGYTPLRGKVQEEPQE